MSAIVGKNYELPALDLNFAENKSLIDSITGRNLITFSRSQSGKEATYVGSDGLIKYASADEPRFDHDPDTLDSLGLLVEESRTNKLINSSTFSSGYTLSADAALDPNYAISPDGTIAASLLRPIADTTIAGLERSIGAVTSAEYIVSVFAKASGKSWLIVSNAQGNIRAWFNLSAGTVGTVQNENIAPYFTTGSIEPYGDGWYRCSVKSTVTFNYFAAYVVDGDNSSNVTVNGNDGILIWGAQLEVGSFPTSYIPTTGSTATRSADVASITGSNFSSWYNQSEGSLLAAMGKQLVSGIGNNLLRLIAIADSNSTSMSAGLGFLMGTHTAASPRIRIRSNTVYGGGLASTIDKWAWAAADNNMSIVYDGSLDSSSTITTMPTVDQLNLFGTCTISRLTYWPKRLPDLELQQLTK